MLIPDELQEIRDKALWAIGKVLPADKNITIPWNVYGIKTGQELPSQYLIYFLLVDLLNFRNLGRSEKLLWSIPIDFEGQVFVIEYRKFGLRIAALVAGKYEKEIQKIVRLIKKGIKAAEPFYKWLATNEIRGSKLNVQNCSYVLFDRYEYFLSKYKFMVSDLLERTKEYSVLDKKIVLGMGIGSAEHQPVIELKKNIQWIALALIDAFFSWTEHIFVHICILSGKITTGIEVANFAKNEWQAKFKSIFDLKELKIKTFFDNLVLIRRNLRNFVTHGAFGKNNESFDFHSSVGAVPIQCSQDNGQTFFTLSDRLGFEDAKAVKIIEEYIMYLKSGKYKAAYSYINESRLPLILTLAQDGTYKKAIQSLENMEKLISYLASRFDQAQNMDW